MIVFARIALFMLFIIMWETGARTGGIDAFIFSSPSRIADTFVSMCRSGDIFVHTGITLAETLLSFILVLTAGILLAILLWASDTVSGILEPYLVILNSLPKSALAPVLIVWLGNNPKTIIVTAISIAVFGTIINLYTSFSQIDSEKIKLIKMLGGNRLDVLFRLILPSSLPIIISNAKVNIGLCLVGVIIGEFLAARKGLGFLIIYGSQTFKMNWVLMSIVILCIIAGVLYLILNRLEKCVNKYMAS
ncbi:MAG: ABC transporter permease [Clostridia bacterium]|nr:ABC transporter permease [[Bacteroides] pectinophilus]MDD5871949.1 ABC transporter permease [Clostridia bacterium]